jgi:hypothetical protein
MSDDIAFCPHCGRARLGEAPFCVKCGNPFGPTLGGSAAAPNPVGDPRQPAPAVPSAVADGPRSESTERAPTTGTAGRDPISAAAAGARTFSTAQWALLGGVGQAIGAALPWAQTSIMGVSVSPLSGLGRDLIFTIALVAAIMAVASSAVMANDASRAKQKQWRNWFLFASIATIICAALVLVAFLAAQGNYGALSGLVSPGIGLLLAGASGVVGVVSMVRPARH